MCWRKRSGCFHFQASSNVVWAQVRLSRTIALRMRRNFRAQAISATLASLPALRRRCRPASRQPRRLLKCMPGVSLRDPCQLSRRHLQISQRLARAVLPDGRQPVKSPPRPSRFARINHLPFLSGPSIYSGLVSHARATAERTPAARNRCTKSFSANRTRSRICSDASNCPARWEML